MTDQPPGEATTTDREGDIAAVLAEHEFDLIGAECACGWTADRGPRMTAATYDQHRAHVAAAITARLAEREGRCVNCTHVHTEPNICRAVAIDGGPCVCQRFERGGEVGALAEVERRIEGLLHGDPEHVEDETRDEALNDALRIVREVAAQQPPDPLAEGVEALAAEWDDYSLEPGSIEDRMRDDLRALLSAREQQADGGAT